MAINILTQNITSDDFVSKGAKNNMKKYIRKELLNISNDNITLEHLRKLEIYYQNISWMMIIMIESYHLI